MGSNTLPKESSSKSISARSIKTEPPEDEIKDFAETAMNELLGWYGYDRREQRWSSSRSGTNATSSIGPSAAPDVPKASQSSTATGSMRRDSVSSIDSGNANAIDKDSDDCSWCNNAIKNDSEVLQQSSGAKYCSELCFSQSRRANFKRAKTCDWCRHVRHTVSYVDFQEGATQLQFCSDKCLNQYKMHIFCRETQAHLDLNPHLVNVASTSNLITPDLWLKNCKSRSASPTSEDSTSPALANLMNQSVSPKAIASLSSPASTPPNIQRSPMPIITVTPQSKLMQKKPSHLEEIQTQRSPPITKKENRLSKINTRKRRNSKCIANVGLQASNILGGISSIVKPPDIKLMSPNFLRDGSPSSITSSGLPSNLVQSPPAPAHPRLSNIQTPNIQPNATYPIPPQFLINDLHSVPNHQLLRPPLFPNHPFLPRLPQYFPHDNPRLPFPGPMTQMGPGQVPPITVLVPYPIILPVPLPIPVPIPIAEICKALHNDQLSNRDIKVESLDNEPNFDGPLDFTMHNKVQDNSENRIVSEANNEETNSKNNTFLGETSYKRHNKNTSPSNEVPLNDLTSNEDNTNPEHNIPQFKITRLGAKMTKIINKSKEMTESTRPLRKRRRLAEVTNEEECNTLVSKGRKIVPV